MQLLRMLTKEILYRRINFILAVLAVIIAVGALLTSSSVLNIYDLHTVELLSRKQAETKKRVAALNDEMRKATLKLGFNLLILPKDQKLRNLYGEDFAAKTMPEDYVKKLTNSGIITVRHFLPILERKIEWPEIKRTIILIGTRGEVPNLFKNPKHPLVQPVPEGTIVLGYQLQESLGLKIGDTVTLMGRKFKVHKFHKERGNKDDITAWISLHEAQELLNKKGLINGIYALKCLCAGQEEMGKLRGKINHFLPDTQTTELGTRVIARAEARLKLKKEAQEIVKKEQENRMQLKENRESLLSIVVTIIMIVCVILIGYLEFTNVKNRVREIGILRSLGYRTGQLLILFLSKSLIIGLLGGLLGFVLGSLSGYQLGLYMEGDTGTLSAGIAIFKPAWLVMALLVSSLLTLLAGWLPALWAIRQDPAEILRKEE